MTVSLGVSSVTVFSSVWTHTSKVVSIFLLLGRATAAARRLLRRLEMWSVSGTDFGSLQSSLSSNSSQLDGRKMTLSVDDALLLLFDVLLELDTFDSPPQLWAVPLLLRLELLHSLWAGGARSFGGAGHGEWLRLGGCTCVAVCGDCRRATEGEPMRDCCCVDGAIARLRTADMAVCVSLSTFFDCDFCGNARAVPCDVDILLESWPSPLGGATADLALGTRGEGTPLLPLTVGGTNCEPFVFTDFATAAFGAAIPVCVLS